MNERRRRTVGILIFDDVEVLDFCGPFEVFSVARPHGENGDEARLFDVLTIAEERRTIRCRGGLLVQPHHAIADHPPLDLLVVPGGQGTRRERANARLLDWIAAQAGRAELTTSVCTGAFLLASAGLLRDRPATTHWASLETLAAIDPTIEVRPDDRWVDDGDVVTAGGVTSGIDMALYLVERERGRAVAYAIAREMEHRRDERVLQAR